MSSFSQFEILSLKGMDTPQGFIHLSSDATTASTTSAVSFDGKSLTVNMRQTLTTGDLLAKWTKVDFEDLTNGAVASIDNAFSGPTMPAYSLGHFVRHLAETGTKSAAFLHLIEATGETSLADLSYSHDDEITDGDGILHSKAAHYSLSVGGQKMHDYWVSNGIIVRTDYPFATSLYTRHPSKAALPPVAAAVLESLDLP